MLVVQEYNQIERVDFEDYFVLVVRLEVIWLLLVFTCYKDFKLFHIDVKCIFEYAYRSICYCRTTSWI